MADPAAPSLPTARELRERSLQAQSELKQRLSSLSQESRELDGRLRGNGGKKGSGGKRSRDERGDDRHEPQEQERSAKARRDSGEGDQDEAAASRTEEATSEPAAGDGKGQLRGRFNEA